MFVFWFVLYFGFNYLTINCSFIVLNNNRTHFEPNISKESQVYYINNDKTSFWSSVKVQRMQKRSKHKSKHFAKRTSILVVREFPHQS